MSEPFQLKLKPRRTGVSYYGGYLESLSSVPYRLQNKKLFINLVGALRYKIQGALKGEVSLYG